MVNINIQTCFIGLGSARNRSATLYELDIVLVKAEGAAMANS